MCRAHHPLLFRNVWSGRAIMTAAFVAVASMIGAGMAQALPREVRIGILQAVVQIIPLDSQAGELVDWSGSGTIISPSGYILTNYHVAGDLTLRRHYEWHAISMTDAEFTDQPPEFYFWAQYVAGDPTHDLALLRIVEWFDEEPVAEDFVFPHVTVGDSNRLLPGDPITIVGYPGISGSTVTLTSGTMSGWLGEDFEQGGKQWIKTDGKIAHGNSGGGAFDFEGNLIGVPTAGRTVQYEELDVEEQAYVRPIGLAWSLIGPNVADVARASGSSQAAATTTTTATSSAAPAPGSSNCDFCTVGGITFGSSTTGSLAAQEGKVNYHTYTVEVPAGRSTLVIAVTADFDLDVTARYGAQITNYGDEGDWDYRDLGDEHGAHFEIAFPAAGIYYIDIMNLYDSGVGNYTLSVY